MTNPVTPDSSSVEKIRFAPGRDRRLLDHLKVVQPRGFAPIPFRNRDNVKARDVEARESASPRVQRMI